MDNRKRRNDVRGLCFRCEHRARYYETGSAPRMECGSPETAVYGCYMYKPVRPVVVGPRDKSDPRPIFGPPMISGRVQFERVATDKDVHLKLTCPNDNEFLLTWVEGEYKEEELD